MNRPYSRFDQDALDSLLEQVKSRKQEGKYEREAILGVIAEAASDPANVILGRSPESDPAPYLNPDPGRDGESAAIIHQYLGSLSPIDAADRRLWSYLSGVVFADYTMDRWTRKSKKWATDRVLLPSSSLNSLSRNSIARLWHSAQKLYDPALEYELSAASGDPYQYVKLMFQSQDIHTGLMMRSAGYNRNLMVGFINAIASDIHRVTSTDVQRLVKELNLKMTYRSFEDMSVEANGDEIRIILDGISEIQTAGTSKTNVSSNSFVSSKF